MTKEERDRLILDELCPKCTFWGKMSNWARFGLLWDLAKKTEWWPDFWEWVFDREVEEYAKRTNGRKMPQYYFWGKIFTGEWYKDKSLINPDRFMDAIADFLTQKKGKNGQIL